MSRSGLDDVSELVSRLPSPERAGAEEVHAALAARLGPAFGRRSWVLAFVNAHAVNMCATSPTAAAAFRDADLLLRDGVGTRILLRALGRDPGANMNGTDLIPRLAAAPGARVAFYGGAPGVAEEAAGAMRRRGVEVVAARHGYHPAAAYERWIARDARPSSEGGGGATLIVLGMGAPRQEALARRLREVSPAPVGIVCGGAILDFLSGRVARAPRWMRACGLEWLHRLALEPRRLFLRYVIGNPAFLLRVTMLALREPSRDEPRGSARQRPAMSA